jgi:hypothetical protein
MYNVLVAQILRRPYIGSRAWDPQGKIEGDTAVIFRWSGTITMSFMSGVLVAAISGPMAGVVPVPLHTNMDSSWDSSSPLGTTEATGLFDVVVLLLLLVCLLDPSVS